MHNNNIKTIFQDLNGENGTDYKRGIILIIDDDRNICEIIYKYLLNNGFKNFIIASDGKQGLKALYGILAGHCNLRLQYAEYEGGRPP